MKAQRELVVECCKAMVARDNNRGDWPDGQIPDCFYQYVDEILPHIRDQLSWVLIVEHAIAHDAIGIVADV